MQNRFIDLSYAVTVKSPVEILQNFVAFSEYMNFKCSFTKARFFQVIMLIFFITDVDMIENLAMLGNFVVTEKFLHFLLRYKKGPQQYRTQNNKKKETYLRLTVCRTTSHQLCM